MNSLGCFVVRCISDDSIQFDIGSAYDDITEVAQHMGLQLSNWHRSKIRTLK